jgi:hypothetical protein
MKADTRSISYFHEPGVDNTDEVIEIVYRRLKEGDIKSVVVASSTGKSGLKFARRMAGETNLVVVSSHPGRSRPGVWDFDLTILKELESLGCKVVKHTHVLSGLDRSISAKFSGVSYGEFLAEALRCLFGVGIKVAIECTIMAADSGSISIEKTIAVGGTGSPKGKGSDCAIVVSPAHCNNFFDFRVLEILAKPYRRDFPKPQPQP